jgi:hypothetical protein
MYRCTGTAAFSVAVEADSLAEAERIIDGVFEGCDEIVFFEDGGLNEGGDELRSAKGTIARSNIRVEN